MRWHSECLDPTSSMCRQDLLNWLEQDLTESLVREDSEPRPEVTAGCLQQW